jgi:hypothetical protein
MFGDLFWLFKLSLFFALRGIIALALVMGLLWCLIALVTGLLQKLRRANDRW